MKLFHLVSAALSNVLRSKRGYLWAIRLSQLALFALAGVTAFLLRFEFSVPADTVRAMWLATAIWVVAKAAVFHSLGLGRGVWRYFSARDMVLVAGANVAACAVSAVVILTLCPAPFPRSALAIDLLLSIVFTIGIRAGTRLTLEVASRAHSAVQKRAFIYGAGAAGALLLHEARSNPAFHYRICGFIDDDIEKHGMLINGLPVYGAGEDLPRLAAAHRAQGALIAVPSACGAQFTRIVENCRRAGIEFHTMPSLVELAAGRATSQIRDVALEDLLGRSAVELNWTGIRRKIENGVVLVTGAAGSIGSELCRQIARFQPAALVGFDCSETALFEIEHEMLRLYPGLAFHPEIGSIQNRHRLSDVFRRYRPSIVYHAAAYKHVPMMESHVFEAIENNVFGTYNVAAISAEFGVADFVMISSDKAVRPTNMMGVTKRVAELTVRSLQNGGPRFASVRFGNVLGSNGSVIPIFKRQIAAGGPVTVTHPEMRRYFMTIPEAAQLVLEASSMAKGGEIFILEMGKPVRIADLARQLVALSGLTPDEDIRIEFTGVRPGEKLFEELHNLEEQTIQGAHEKIRIYSGASLPHERMAYHLNALRAACEGRDLLKLVLELKDVVPDYNPSKELLARLIDPGHFRLARAVEAAEGVRESVDGVRLAVGVAL
ncbi:MAG: nucleoside-diphosphate sugar epimerase/dehydratase [Bryobacteraceae bacterium]